MRAWLIGWRHKTNRCCKIQRTLGLRTKQWRTSFCNFWRVISRQKKLSRTRFMVISLSSHLYFTFLRKTVGKKKFRRSSTLKGVCAWLECITWHKFDTRTQVGRSFNLWLSLNCFDRVLSLPIKRQHFILPSCWARLLQRFLMTVEKPNQLQSQSQMQTDIHS